MRRAGSPEPDSAIIDSMRFPVFIRFASLLFVAGLPWACVGLAQQLPPAEPPKPMPRPSSEASLTVTTTEVLVPTLVEKRDGTILYGL